MKHLLSGIVCVLICFFLIGIANAQLQSLSKNNKKNIIKFNLTANVLYDDAIMLEYERVIKNRQSFAIQVGHAALPFVWTSDTSSVNLKSNLEKSGYAVTLDYRFYLAKENKDQAPHGIYIAPFVSYHHFVNARNLDVKNAEGIWEESELRNKVNLISFGACLGYQFLLGERWTIDFLLLGPSITNYKVSMKLEGNLNEAEIQQTLQQVLQGLSDEYSYIHDLFEDQSLEFKGKANTWNYGFRYSVHVGFRF